MIDMREHGLSGFSPLIIHSIQVVLHYFSYTVTALWLDHFLYIHSAHMQWLTFIGICYFLCLHHQELAWFFKQGPVFFQSFQFYTDPAGTVLFRNHPVLPILFQVFLVTVLAKRMGWHLHPFIP